MIGGGGTDFDEAMAWAAEEVGVTRISCVLCHESGATGVDNAMICAADKGHESIVRLCRKLGAVDIDATMAQAAGKATS